MALLADEIVAVGGPEAIRDTDCALAIWRRDVPLAVEQAVASIDLGVAEPVFVSARVDVLEAVLTETLGQYPVALREDIQSLAERLAAVMRVDAVTVRLEPIATDACRQFHADHVTLRLLTTYVGRATQWVRSETPDEVQQIGPGEVALFKGRLLADPPPILHRSPPIAGTGEHRLLLVVDPVHGA